LHVGILMRTILVIKNAVEQGLRTEGNASSLAMNEYSSLKIVPPAGAKVKPLYLHPHRSASVRRTPRSAVAAEAGMPFVCQKVKAVAVAAAPAEMTALSQGNSWIVRSVEVDDRGIGIGSTASGSARSDAVVALSDSLVEMPLDVSAKAGQD